MIWWGKILGGGVGYMLSGLYGALGGLAVGQLLDFGYRYLRPMARGQTADKDNTSLFLAMFSVMGHLAKADGRVSPAEIEATDRLIQGLGLLADQRRTAIGLFHEGKAGDFPLDRVLKQFYKECGGHFDTLRVFLEAQAAVAAAGGITPEKEKMLIRIAQRIGFSTWEVEQIIANSGEPSAYRHFRGGGNRRGRASERNQWRPHEAETGPHRHQTAERSWRARQKAWRKAEKAARQADHKKGYRKPKDEELSADMRHAYAILGVSPNVGPSELKLAYRRLMSQHHPDKLIAQSRPAHVIQSAKDRTQNISRAYHRIRRARGF